MTTAVQRRRGTNTEHASFTGLEGEISVNTTNESVHVHDGSTAGGFELMRADGSNSSVSLGDITGVTAGTGLSGGGTSGTVTLNIDGTVATLTGTQTLTNKTLTSPILNTPDINAGSIDGTAIGASSASTGAFTTLTATGIDVTGTATMDGISSNGNVSVVGAGNTRTIGFDFYGSSKYNFHVDGTTDADKMFIRRGTTNVANFASNGDISFYEDTGTTPKLFWDASAESLGIGTSSPSRPLTVNGNNGTGMIINDATNDKALRFRATGDAFFIEATNNAESAYANLALEGNVGIGTSSPASALSVATNGGAWTTSSSDGVGINYNSGNANISTYLDNSTLKIGAGVTQKNGMTIYGQTGGNRIQWDVAGSERMRIDSSGRVGIGTSSPSKTLVVNENDSECVAIIKSSDTGTAGLFLGGQTDEIKGGIVFNNSDNSLQLRGYNNAERMRIDSSGNLLVGTTTSSSSGTGRITAKGLANGSIFTIISDQSAYGSGTLGHIRFLNSNGAVGQISTSGSSTSYNTSSDYRLKENVVELTGATERLKQLNPSRFNFIADADTTVDGFLAHEVADVVPEAVSGEKDAVDADGNPEYQGIDQSKLVPLLVATIQELEARITQLENN